MMIPPKRFDIGCSEGLDAFRFFFKNKRATRGRRHDICKPDTRRIQVHATYGKSTMASESARARLLWAIPSLFLPVTCGHTTRHTVVQHWVSLQLSISPMKRSAPCSAICNPSEETYTNSMYGRCGGDAETK